MSADIDLRDVQRVQASLHEVPQRAEHLASALEMKPEAVYRALVWLNDQELAQVARNGRRGVRTVTGWVAA